ncbi:SDR family oxidoreductase [Frankia sp. Cpl3]|uniref:hypothetical protein n=1 Tax=Parafrankia colletiae TaxID=573497 RepID=UPI0012FF5E58|nr:hypothetical protein [Parafrankia colletiae]MCK9901667.1 SDR family oxidoreductase [Frankia sp. Cpl3]
MEGNRDGEGFAVVEHQRGASRPGARAVAAGGAGIALLARPESRWITGQNLHADGGLT